MRTLNQTLRVRNPKTGESFLCDNWHRPRRIDSQEFVEVYQLGGRKMLMNKAAFELVKRAVWT